MTDSTLREERVRGYFLEAAKEIIRGEGIEAISARNIAERAGYSYATLYNYFHDIRDLIFSCIEDFMDECREFVTTSIPAGISPDQRLIRVTKQYANYFVQYPGIFELMYTKKPSDVGTKVSPFGGLRSFFLQLTIPAWEELVPGGGYSPLAGLHYYAVHGYMLFYLSGRLEVSYGEFVEELTVMTGNAVDLTASNGYSSRFHNHR